MSDYQINKPNSGQAERVLPSMRVLSSKSSSEEQRTTALDAPQAPPSVFERQEQFRHEKMMKILIEQSKNANPDKLMQMQKILEKEPRFPSKQAVEQLAQALLSEKQDFSQNPLMDA